MAKYDLSKPFDRDRFKTYCNKVYEKQDLVVMTKPQLTKRSLNQNALYWLWLTCLEKESDIGYSKEDFHNIFKVCFLRYDDELLTQYITPQWLHTITYSALNIMWEGRYNVFVDAMTASTKTLSKKEMTDYMEKVKAKVLEVAYIDLPDPDDIRINDFVKQYL